MAATASSLIAAVAAVYATAYKGRYTYGDSHGNPPCSDKIISCDRLIARALYNLGYTDQPKGASNKSSGITVINMESYLLKWGFKKITDQTKLKAGDIVLFRNANTTPNAGWHTFLLVSYTNANKISKYDCGSQARINSVQPFTNVSLNEWNGTRWFYAAFRAPGNNSGTYSFSPQVVKKGSTGASQYLANEILLARGCHGVTDKDTGKLKSLALNNTWTIGDMCAMAETKLGRCRAGYDDMANGTYGAGEIGPKDWSILLGSGLPFQAVELPTKQTEGVVVLLLQEILRANGYKGKDDKLIGLDRKWGENTEFAVKQWQKDNGMSQTGKVTYDVWKKMLKGL